MQKSNGYIISKEENSSLMMNNIKIYCDDNLNVLPTIEDESIDCTITSPPYDNLRTYDNTLIWNDDKFHSIANELYRVTKRAVLLFG